MWFIIKNTLYKNKYCVLPIVPWENGKRKGEKTIQNLYFFIMVKWGKKERKVKKWQILCMFSCFVQFVQMQKMRKIVRLTGADGMRILKPHQNHRQCIRMQFLLPAMGISKFRSRFSAQDSSFDE